MDDQPKKPSPRPTRDQQEERITQVAKWLARGNKKSEIKALCCKSFGEVSARTVERYLADARKLLMAEFGKDKNEFRADSLAVYQEIVQDDNVDLRDRLRAQERIDILLGLEAPRRINISDEEIDDQITKLLEGVAPGGEA